MECSLIWKGRGVKGLNSIFRDRPKTICSQMYPNTSKREGLWSYNNKEFRPKHCSSTLYRRQLNDLSVKKKDLKAYVPFNTLLCSFCTVTHCLPHMSLAQGQNQTD
ncbi:hypothetical protein XENOCAPTIV_028502 [Xenoophorus captivus]|uniref:Uncharacterized protein n=1 Tax=Xenoophorus captivus TaxID=1517983 RepID=A0ABV0QKU6_9TELE